MPRRLFRLYFKNRYQHRVVTLNLSPYGYTGYTGYTGSVQYREALYRAYANKETSNLNAVNNPAKLFKTMPNVADLSRFDLFVRLKPEALKKFSNNSLTWCHRGDKYIAFKEIVAMDHAYINNAEPGKQLRALLNMIVNNYRDWELCVLRDNESCEEVLKLDFKNKKKWSRLQDYQDFLKRKKLPKWLY